MRVGDGATGAALPRRSAPAAARSPRAVTRGESQREERAKVDWLAVTFDASDLSVQGIAGFLGAVMARPVAALDTGRGMLGFKTRVGLHAYVGAVMAEVGSIAYGGDAQKGRWLLQLTGRGCGLVDDWASLATFVEELPGAKLTRVDLAVDFLNGERTVDEAVEMYRRGEFASQGRPPQSHLDGDWLDGVHGRTLNIGVTGNGKTLCVYEKGKQLGDLQSRWTRFEVRLGNRDRVIPFETLTDPTRFFKGAYPALEAMLVGAAESIPTNRAKAQTTLAHLLFHLKRCYGKPLDAAFRIAGAGEAELIEELRIVELPKRLDPAGVAAGLMWSQVRDSLRRFLQ